MMTSCTRQQYISPTWGGSQGSTSCSKQLDTAAKTLPALAGKSKQGLPERAGSHDITSCKEELLLLLVWQSSQAGGAQQEHWGPAMLPCRHNCCSPVQ